MKKKRLIIALVVLLLAGGVIWYFTRPVKGTEEELKETATMVNDILEMDTEDIQMPSFEDEMEEEDILIEEELDSTAMENDTAAIPV